MNDPVLYNLKGDYREQGHNSFHKHNREKGRGSN